MGIDYRQYPWGKIEIMTFGIEYSRKAIVNWCRLAMRNRPWDPDGTLAPDAVDRAKMKPR
jgi:hypothetical protein